MWRGARAAPEPSCCPWGGRTVPRLPARLRSVPGMEGMEALGRRLGSSPCGLTPQAAPAGCWDIGRGHGLRVLQSRLLSPPGQGRVGVSSPLTAGSVRQRGSQHPKAGGLEGD